MMRRRLYIVDGYRTPFTKIGTELSNIFHPIYKLYTYFTLDQVVGKGAGAYIKARKRKPKGRLNIDDIKRALGKSKAQNR